MIYMNIASQKIEERAAMTEKHLHGRHEPIIDPDLPLIDTHHHLYVRPDVDYMLPELLADLNTGHDIRATIYVETRFMSRPDGPEHLRPLGEIEFANGIGAMGASGFFGPCRFAAAIVAHIDLARPAGEIDAYLDQARGLAPDRLRGVRQITMDAPDPSIFAHLQAPPPSGILFDPRFRQNFGLLGKHGLSFDAAVFHHQLPELARLADEHPETVIILDHMGMALTLPGGDRDAVFRDWQCDLRKLARRPNVHCKIGGLGMSYWGFGFHLDEREISSTELAAVWWPYIETAIAVFGPDRCMLESNYPPDGRSCGYVPIWNAFKLCIADLSLTEKAAIAHGTAERIYRIAI